MTELSGNLIYFKLKHSFPKSTNIKTINGMIVPYSLRRKERTPLFLVFKEWNGMVNQHTNLLWTG